MPMESIKYGPGQALPFHYMPSLVPSNLWVYLDPCYPEIYSSPSDCYFFIESPHRSFPREYLRNTTSNFFPFIKWENTSIKSMVVYLPTINSPESLQIVAFVYLVKSPWSLSFPYIHLNCTSKGCNETTLFIRA